MIDLSKTKFYIPEVSRDLLYKKGFSYSKIYSDESNDTFTYLLPVFTYKNKTMLECRFLVELKTGEITMIVMDSNTRMSYAPWYNNSPAFIPIIAIINKNIMNFLNDLGAVGK